MSEELVETEITQETLETETLPESVEVTPELPELTHRYQPTDEEGRVMGGEQVLKYRTTEELIGKIQEQNILLTRKLREVTRKNRLGIIDTETLPEDAKRHPKLIELKPRELTPEDRVKLSRDILDPDRFDEAQDEIFASRFGVKPTEFRESYQDMQERLSIIQGQQEVAGFMTANPGYYACDHNRNTIVNWLAKNNLALVRDNFQLAYDTLREFMVTPAPLPVPAIPAAVVADLGEPPDSTDINTPEPLATAPTPPVAPKRVATGITKSQASNAAPAKILGSDITYEVTDPYSKVKRTYTGLAAVDAMNADEYKKRVNNDPTFLARVDRMEKEAEAARNAR